MTKNKKLQSLFGILGGLVLPFITIVLLNVFKYKQYNLWEFITGLIRLEIAGRFIQFAAIPNLALFFILLQLKKMYAARGVIAATFILVILVLLLMI